MAWLLRYELLLHPLDDHLGHDKVHHEVHHPPHHQHHVSIALGPSDHLQKNGIKIRVDFIKFRGFLFDVPKRDIQTPDAQTEICYFILDQL